MTIQITHSEAASSGFTLVSPESDRDLGEMRDEFDRNHCIRFEGLFSDALLAQIHDYIDSDEFSFREHDGIGTELCIEQGKSPAFLMFVTNDPAFFELVRKITGCGQIGFFNGRVYRMHTGPEHQDSWHDDLVGGRMIAMSINLSEAPYRGGILEIRDRASREVIHTTANTGPGDAVLFRLAPELQHRVTAVEGDVPKTAYAGWFESGEHSPLLGPDRGG
jgi:hypothetical protein